jgi:hypothetical protein
METSTETYEFNSSEFLSHKCVVQKNILRNFMANAEMITLYFRPNQITTDDQLEALDNKLNEQTLVAPKEIGQIQYSVMLIFDSVKTMFYSNFKEKNQTVKKLTLHEWFDYSKGKKFRSIMSRIADDKYSMTGEEFLIFVVAADIYQLDENIFKFLFDQFCSNIVTWQVYSLFANSTMAVKTNKYMTRCLDFFQNKLSEIQNDHSNFGLHINFKLNDVPDPVFVTQRCRNFLISVIKKKRNEFKSEDDLLSQLVNRIIDIETKYHFSIKAVNDFMGGLIDWFYVSDNVKTSMLEILHKHFEGFKTSSKMTSDMRQRLVNGYNHKKITNSTVKIFSYSEKLMIPLTYPHVHYFKFDKKTLYPKIYTTTLDVRCIDFVIMSETFGGRNGKSFIVIDPSPSMNENNFGNFNLHIGISVYTKINNDYVIVDGKSQWNWTFTIGNRIKHLNIQVPDKTSEYKIVFHRVYLVPPNTDSIINISDFDSDSDSYSDSN